MRKDLRLIVVRVASRFNIFLTGDFVNPKLYYTNKPYSGEDTFISDVVGNELMVEDPTPGLRPYFIIKSDNLPDVLSATRLIDIPEVENFRDQGGYVAKDGRTVKWGKLLRGGPFFNLPDEGKAYLDNMEIKNIFDYRDVDEAGKAPDYVPKGTTHYLVPAMRVNMTNKKADANVHKTIEESADEVTSEEIYQEHIDGFKLLYTDLPFHNPSYEKLFEAMDRGESLYQHCSAGKDRTGVGCALALFALGVDKETIIGDYLLSATYREEVNKKIIDKLSEMKVNEYGVKLFKRLMSVEREFIQTSFDKICEKYDCREAFFSEEYGITEDRLANWRNLYLV